MATMCPYCAIEISESAIEAEDGCCPECGATLAVRSAYDDGDIDDYDDADDLFEDDDDDAYYDDDDDTLFDEFDELDGDDFEDDDFEDEPF